MSLIKKAAELIIVRHPFYAGLLLDHKVVETDAIEFACIGNGELIINPKFYNGLSLPEQLFLLCHEIMHIALLHHVRRGAKDPELWNIAADYVINLGLSNYGLTLIEGSLLDKQYEGMSTEQVYNKLAQNPQDVPGYQPMGEFTDEGEGLTKEEVSKLTDAVIQKVSLAQYSAESRNGKLPEDFIRELGELKSPSINWAEQLAVYMTETDKSDYNWARPNRRYLGSGFILPSMHSDTLGHVVIAVDTSGSMGQETLDEIAAEVNNIGELFESDKSVVYCDSQINGEVELFPAGEMLELTFRGGGGTSFAPPLTHEYELDPEVLLYFTDGYSRDFAEQPNYPVVWIINGRHTRDFNPPYGEVIYKC